MEALNLLYIIAALIITLPIASLKFYSKQNLPGIVLCLAIAAVSWYLGQIVPLAGASVIGIFIGMLMANFWRIPNIMKSGINDTSKKMLQSAVVLLGFQMNLGVIMGLGGRSIALILLAITVALLTAYIFGRKLGLVFNEKALIGVGTAICGGSAIAAAAPVIKASDKEVASAISTIFLFNVIAVLVFPIIGRLFGMSDMRFGMWAGSAINDTSSVVSVAFTYSDTAGDIATIVKLCRALMIIPVTFMLALYQAKKDGGSGDFRLSKALPLFILAFLVASVINTIGIIPADTASAWGRVSRFMIVMAMVAIGLNTNIKELIKRGGKAVLLGLFCAVAVAVTSALFLVVFQI